MDISKIDDIIKLAKAYYRKPDNGCGGNLHLVLDDGNTEIAFVAYCYKRCILEGDTAGENLAYQLLMITEMERDLIYDRYSEYMS